MRSAKGEVGAPVVQPGPRQLRGASGGVRCRRGKGAVFGDSCTCCRIMSRVKSSLRFIRFPSIHCCQPHLSPTLFLVLPALRFPLAGCFVVFCEEAVRSDPNERRSCTPQPLSNALFFKRVGGMDVFWMLLILAQYPVISCRWL